MLTNFLLEETFPSSRELLFMHYLQRGRYVEGIRLNEVFKKDKLVCMQISKPTHFLKRSKINRSYEHYE